jgi:hypothetical protein
MRLTDPAVTKYIESGAGGYAPLFSKKESMLMKRLLALACVAALSVTSVRADVPVNTPSQNEGQAAANQQKASLYDAASPFALFDMSRLTMHQSYSLSYFSGPAGGQSVGLYMNSIGYQLARPLYLQVDIGVMHDPGALVGHGNPSSGVHVLPNFSLRYTPSPKFNLMIDVRTMPGYNTPYAGYIPGYGSNYWMR